MYSEAISLDGRRGSVLVRRGKGGRRRQVAMDDWAWEHIEPWLKLRAELPVGPLFCVVSGTNLRASVVGQRRSRATWETSTCSMSCVGAISRPKVRGTNGRPLSPRSTCRA
jgi:site-specific recombinase XerC